MAGFKDLCYPNVKHLNAFNKELVGALPRAVIVELAKVCFQLNTEVTAVPGGAGLGAVVPGRAHQRHAVQPLPVEDLVLRHGVAEVGARGADLHDRDPGLQVKTYHRGR